MNIWLENSKRNLFEFSNEKDDFSIAIMEWEFSGEMIDHGTPIENCQLCEKDRIRYQFGIVNESTQKRLLMGSSCIAKFDIKVLDEAGKEITQNKDHYLKQRIKRQHVFEKLEELSKRKTQGGIRGYSFEECDEFCLNEYFQQDHLSPRMTNYLFLRFEMESIPFDPACFKVNLRSNAYKEQFKRLNEKQFRRIQKALSTQQAQLYRKQ